MGDDMLSSFNSAISAAASVINGAASVLGSTFDIDETKELHEWSHEKSQEWMREDPAISLQGLKNAGLSPVSATGNYIAGGSSGTGYPHAPAVDKAQRMALFNESIMAADQLKTTQAQRELLNAQATKENAEAALFGSQTQGQLLSNQDYKSALDMFGGVLTTQSYNNFVNGKITENSIPVEKLSNDFRSAVLQGQINDPEIIKAIQSTPIQQQNEIISLVAKNYQECNLMAAKIITEGSVQDLNKALGTHYRSMAEYYDEQTDFNVINRPFEIDLTKKQIRQIYLANQLATQNNPHSLESAISDLNTAPWKRSFYRGAYNYLLNGVFSVLGSGVQAGATVHAGNRIADAKNQPTSGFGALRNSAPPSVNGRRFRWFK